MFLESFGLVILFNSVINIDDVVSILQFGFDF